MAPKTFDEALALIQEELQYFFVDPILLKIALRIPGMPTEPTPTGMMMLAHQGQACVDAKQQYEGTFTGKSI